MSERFTTHVRDLPDAPKWLSVVVPTVVYPLIILAIFVHRPFYNMMMRKEGGIEYVAVAFLIVGVAYGVRLLLRYRDRLPARWLVWWFALGTLGMFAFAGEEISWGQHLKLWDHDQVPGFIQAVNDQNETNFHNMSNALDQGPTNLVVFGTFVAFVVIPLYLRYRGETMATDNPGYWFWPTRAGLIAALGVLLIPFPKRIYEWITGEDGPSLMRHSEMHEFYVALLMTTYIISVYYRLRAMPPAADEQPAADTPTRQPRPAETAGAER